MPKQENHQLPLQKDAALLPYWPCLEARSDYAASQAKRLKGRKKLRDASDWHLFYGLHRQPDGSWMFREWLPNATGAFLIGDFNRWLPSPAFSLSRNGDDWTEHFPADAIHAGEEYRVLVQWKEGSGERIPSAATEISRSTRELWRSDVSFNARVSEESAYRWKHPVPPLPEAPLIYEAHVGMAQDSLSVGTFDAFRENVLPRVAKGGYNVLQLMGIQQHPYYASFGYHVSSFFATFDLLGGPDAFRRLIDEAHGMGLRVIIDLVHSHAATNEVEGISRLDGSQAQFFHEGERGWHPAWGSRVFDYGKLQVQRFLLSNCRFWLEEYHLDGFRFDGITSMLYRNHGLGCGLWNYDGYFQDSEVDLDAIAYLANANRLIHEIRPDAITIAEDVSGYPGLGAPLKNCGIGFDYRLAMGVTDYWFKLTDLRDEDWDLGHLWYELNSRRGDEKTISYVECHDQALVGGRTFLFTLTGAEMYYHMAVDSPSMAVDRGIALHKMARLLTFATAGFGYLNFMGNEFGHPEWIDFPTERNGWSFAYARRQWHLADDSSLRFGQLGAFDRRMTALSKEYPDMFQYYTRLLRIHQEDKLLAFSRGNLLFLLNFHPWKSYSDYEIPVPGSGCWRWIMDTDQPEFGGFQRIAPSQRFFTEMREENGADSPVIHVYLPCRTAMVLSWEPEKQSRGKRPRKTSR